MAIAITAISSRAKTNEEHYVNTFLAQQVKIYQDQEEIMRKVAIILFLVYVVAMAVLPWLASANNYHILTEQNSINSIWELEDFLCLPLDDSMTVTDISYEVIQNGEANTHADVLCIVIEITDDYSMQNVNYNRNLSNLLRKDFRFNQITYTDDAFEYYGYTHPHLFSLNNLGIASEYLVHSFISNHAISEGKRIAVIVVEHDFILEINVESILKTQEERRNFIYRGAK
jgi:hypothetical protein